VPIGSFDACDKLKRIENIAMGRFWDTKYRTFTLRKSQVGKADAQSMVAIPMEKIGGV